MRLAVGSDHAGYSMTVALADFAARCGHVVERYGATSEEPFDYPDAADPVAQAILEGRADQGVLVCGTGIGVCIRANRFEGIRAAECCSVEMAELARAHNHANIVCLGARTTSLELAEQILLAFWDSPEDQAERHKRRVEKLDGNVDIGPGVRNRER